MSSKHSPEYYIKLAMREAEKARGMSSPNPFVGAVIVKNDHVIAVGHTQAYGKDHAEIQALKQAGDNARGADIYVTLEPCCHWGKTPPCTQAIIDAGIKRVFFGIRDPNPLVNPDMDAPGPGILTMRESGIEVSWGFLIPSITRQLEYFISRIIHQRPFVTLKTALSMDGKYAAQDGSSRWISAPKSRHFTHKMRENHDVVLTGINTVLKDDPELTVRLPHPKRQPLRVVLDPELMIPEDARLIQTLQIAPLLVFTQADNPNNQKANRLRSLGAEVIGIDGSACALDLHQVMAILHDRGCYSIMAECGSCLASELIRTKLVDKLVFFYGAKIVGGNKAMFADLGISIISDAIALEVTDVKKLSGDIMLTAYPIY